MPSSFLNAIKDPNIVNASRVLSNLKQIAKRKNAAVPHCDQRFPLEQLRTVGLHLMFFKTGVTPDGQERSGDKAVPVGF
jgi:hypothetical protein